MNVVEILLVFMGCYVALGIVFAVWFVLRGASRVDPVTRVSTWGFRILILPGSAALWPWLLVEWRATACEDRA